MDLVETADLFDEAVRRRQELVRFVEAQPDHPNVPTAVWALGKLFDKELKPLFEEVLRHHVEGDSGALYQAIIALDNLDVDFPEAHGSYSLDDVEKNRRMARAYLERR
jgi:hypothetical protein